MELVKKSFFKFFGYTDILGFPPQSNDVGLSNLLWIIKLRWIAISLFFLVAIPGLVLGYLNSSTMPIYMGIVASLFLFNLVSHLVWSSHKKGISSYSIYSHLVFDLIALAGLIYSAGGWSNPFVLMFLLNASLGGLLIPGVLSWIFLVLCHLFLGIIQIFYFLNHSANPIELSRVAALHLAIFCFWIVMRTLGRYLEKKQHEQIQFRVAVEKQDRLRAVGALAAGFSHEFASPLNAVRIRLERAIRTYQKDENLIEALDAIQDCEQVIYQMNSSQIDSRTFNPKQINASNFIEDIVDSWKEQNVKAEIILNLNKDSIIQVAPVNFAQVIINLLDNANEASGTSPIYISFKTENLIHSLEIEDRGSGVPDLVLSKLGEPFITTKDHGTGLGLYVSQLFVQSLGGDLSIKNLEQGCRITLTWPVVGKNNE